MLIYAAVCPHPPLLVPELAGDAAKELDALRAACGTAVRGLEEAVRAAGGDAAIVVVGGGAGTRAYGPDAVATLGPYGLVPTASYRPSENGVSGTVGGADSVFGEPVKPAELLPLSLTIGRWLLRDLPPGVPVRFQSVAYDAAPRECLALGRKLAGQADERVALLVMGDGSACLSAKAPGYLDPRAEPYDAGVAEALRLADTGTLADLDPGISREVQAAGRAAWQVLAGAAEAPRTPHEGAPHEGTPHGRVSDGRASGERACADAAGTVRERSGRSQPSYDAELLAYEAPYGVGYFVATWNGLTTP
ncbi:class III extradiol dioxygenase subunit B-like domain-containing protein [Actinomadura vinacea]|uniref:Class III extradiol dioxygenase subunit B-like domain-containing protein n=1 Tax=Actinomadura vinacea TaxID=115336 RepID=A0ABN3KF90_9ACTN